MYDVRDILKKAIEISNQKKALYIESCHHVNDAALTLVLKVITIASEKEMAHYESMIRNISDEMAEGIDFGTYDKISSLINQFTKFMYVPEINSKNEFLRFVINLEEQIYALLVDIQGRMVTNEAVASSVSYYVLSELISEKENYIRKLKGFTS